MLLGRRKECLTLTRLLDEARSGSSGVLVVRGAAGVGKSALLEYGLDSAFGFRVARAAGVESEMELAFAGLQQLCASLLDGLPRLSAPQRAALETAFGMSDGPQPDVFIVGLAVLGLLADTAREEPLLCVIDDAQWLDRASAQAVALAGRRLQADSVALLFSLREPSERDEFANLPELRLEGLSDVDALELLASVVTGRLDDRVAARLVAEAQGNPLALLELPRTTTPADMAGGFALGAAPLSSRLEAGFLQRAAQLPPQTQRLLLLAAAEPVGDAAVVWRAAAILGIAADDAAAPAEDEGLLDPGPPVRFRHPLVRSALYRAAPASERRRVHTALGEATEPSLDPDRRAWHLAQAASGPDERIADELERSANRA
ncbi:MAG TPA: AAA family ATPase, partial [Acidimicrobiales bacterium]|nr:AAA family ATPase [Acidimicrobiales bacterium]